jgi:hypothetical protein
MARFGFWCCRPRSIPGEGWARRGFEDSLEVAGSRGARDSASRAGWRGSKCDHRESGWRSETRFEDGRRTISRWPERERQIGQSGMSRRAIHFRAAGLEQSRQKRTRIYPPARRLHHRVTKRQFDATWTRWSSHRFGDCGGLTASYNQAMIAAMTPNLSWDPLAWPAPPAHSHRGRRWDSAVVWPRLAASQPAGINRYLL